MFKGALQEMINIEFDTSMGYSKYDKKSNYRNHEFEPQIVPKSTRDVSGVEDKITSLYGRCLTTREINNQIQDLYGIEISTTTVSNITNKIIPEIKEWQERSLDKIYPFVFIDAVHFSVR